MTVITAAGASTPPIKSSGLATDAARDAGPPGQPAAVRRGVGVHTPDYLERQAYLASPEYRAREAKWQAQVATGQTVDKPHTFGTIGEIAAYGETVTGLLRSWVDHVNAMRASLAPEYLDQIRAFMGEEVASKVQSRRTENLAESRCLVSRLEEEIGGTFTVSGTLVQRHDDGGVSIGDYTLSFSGSGFGVQVGSNGHTFVDQGDGSYRHHQLESRSEELPNGTKFGFVDKSA